MAKAKKTKKDPAPWTQDLMILLNTDSTIEILQNPDCADPNNQDITNLLQQVSLVYPAAADIEMFLNIGCRLTLKTPDSPLHQAFCVFKRTRQDYKITTQITASHKVKRSLVYNLGISRKRYSISDLLAAPGALSMPAIVWRQPGAPPKRYSWMAESGAHKDHLIVSKATGYYIVEKDESVIFLSGTPAAPVVELVVIRAVGFDAPEHAALYRWLQGVVWHACRDRRNQRPTHPGSMAQIGWNTGPRHATVFGLAKSFNKKLDTATMIADDEDAIAALTLMWGLVQAHMPTDITSHVEQALEESGLPRLATRNVAEGTGYRIELDGKKFSFPFVPRAPPEGYMSQDYEAWTHTDPAYAQFAFSWCVGRNDGDAKKPGGSFIDAENKVVVKGDVGTLTGFRPGKSHGTSRLFGAHKRAITITFSRKIKESFDRAREKGLEIVAEEGAGEGGRSYQNL